MLNGFSVAFNGADQEGIERAARSIRKQKFCIRRQFEWPSGRLWCWGAPAQANVEDTIIREPLGVAACIGVFGYKKTYGKEALRLFLNDTADVQRLNSAECSGNYALFFYRNGQGWLLNDYLGLVRIYLCADGKFLSTSWLATCAYTGSISLNKEAATEYVLLGASHSIATVAREVTILRLGNRVNLINGNVDNAPIKARADYDWGKVSLNEAADILKEELRVLLRALVTAFPRGVRTALSGGFDSRLILAGLLCARSDPSLFVYGEKYSPDVRIADIIARGLNLKLDIFDKSLINASYPVPDIEQLVRNALFFDGLPNDGIYDRGGDQATRLMQTASGKLVLNGGGGEIFRNFFHLPNKKLSVLDIVKAFYRGFDGRVFRYSKDLGSYESRLGNSILKVLGADETTIAHKMPRKTLELIFPKFRCHYWMGVNNSVETRYGYFMTPLVEQNLTWRAYNMPINWKNAGMLQSRLIRALSCDASSYTSEYGFSFHDGPTVKARMLEWSNNIRPIGLRPWINAVHRRVRNSTPSSGFLSHCRELLPGEWQVEDWLRFDYLPSEASLNRAFTVELLLRKML